MMISRTVALCLGLLLFACSKGKQTNQTQKTSPAQNLEGNAGVQVTSAQEAGADDGFARGGAKAGTKLDYPQLYCEFVEKIELRADVVEELPAICKDGTPTKLMLDYRSEALSKKDGEYQIRILKEEVLDEQSEYHLIWSFRVPKKPFDVKKVPIYKYVTVPYTSELLDMKTVVTENPVESLDPSGLHLWSVDIQYDLVLNAAPNFPLYNSRKTQYNMYQVQSASEEMGFGLEQLVDGNEENFSKYKFLNIAFNDGTGYNDGRGGTVIIGYLHLKVNNQGFPAVARDAVVEIAERSINNLSAVLLQ